MLVDEGRLALARGFEVVLPKGCVELETGFLLELLGLLNGVDVVLLLVVELGVEEALAVELGFVESSVCEFVSFDVEP